LEFIVLEKVIEIVHVLGVNLYAPTCTHHWQGVTATIQLKYCWKWR